MGTAPAIEFRNVGYRLPDGRALLNDVTLEVAMGTTVALLGKSGSGKTTLLRTVNRMHGVSSGDVLVRGRSIFEQQDILLMDEPFGALDPLTRAEMQDVLRRLTLEVQGSGARTAVLLVTHDLDEALYLAERVVLIEDGSVAADLAAEDFLSSTVPAV